jgi:hypothetical protein
MLLKTGGKMKKHLDNINNLSSGEHSLEEVLRLAGFEPAKVSCSVCKDEFRDGDNIRSIEETGMCLTCDHIYGQSLDEEKGGEE